MQDDEDCAHERARAREYARLTEAERLRDDAAFEALHHRMAPAFGVRPVSALERRQFEFAQIEASGYPPRPEPAPRPIRRKRRRGAW